MRIRGCRRVLPLTIALTTAACVAQAAVVQSEGVRITVLGQVMPYKLPRNETTPIAVLISGHLADPSGGVPPQLQKLKIRINRNGVLQSRGLPVCRMTQIEAVSTAQALRNCGSALIGAGQFWANIIFSGQPPYPTRGRLLIFNGRRRGKPALFAQIFTANPFNSSFVIPFSIRHIAKGRFGTELTASLPEALGSWGYLDRIKLTLKRTYNHRGRRLSYFNASCPAPRFATRVAFPLARATFFFADRKPVGITLDKSCGVRE